MMENMKINQLPSKTWNWLKMNETVIGMPRIDGSIAIKQRVAEAGQAEAEQLRMACRHTFPDGRGEFHDR